MVANLPAPGKRELSPRASLKVAAGFMLLACIVAYLPGLSGPLFFDDLPNLKQSAHLSVEPTVFDSWRAALVSNNSGILRRPLAILSFAANHAVAGQWSPAQLKATNLAIHLLVGVLLYFWFLLLLRAPMLEKLADDEQRRRAIALLAAGIWLLHPLHVSTVLYAVQRMAQLSTLFVLAGLWLFTRYRLRWAANGAQVGEILAAALWLLLIALLAIFSKENGVLLLWLIAVIEVFLFCGVWAGRTSARLRIFGWCALLLPMLLVAIGFIIDPGLLDGRYSRREFSMDERLLTQARMLWHYLGWIVLPDITALGFHHDDIPVSTGIMQPVTTLLAITAWAGALIVALAVGRRLPLPVFALAFYLVAHSMESTFWPLEMVYEHRNYLPATAICLLLSYAAHALAKRVSWLRFGALGTFVLIVLAGTLALRAGFWGDEINLARHNVINHPESPRAHFFYANSLFKALDQPEKPDPSAESAEGGHGKSSEQLSGKLSKQEQTAYLVAARKHFMRMHELDPRDFAALVMLYQLDNNYFPELPERPDWIEKMVTLAANRRLQASDRTALEALAKNAASTEPLRDDSQVLALLDALPERYASGTAILLARHRLLVTLQAKDQAAQLQVLQQAMQNHPADLRSYPHLVQHHAARDLPASYETIVQWMAADSLRRDLPFIKRLFERREP